MPYVSSFQQRHLTSFMAYSPFSAYSIRIGK